MTKAPEEMYRRLMDRFGPQQWWPAQGPMEMMIGAILTQNTRWRNVEKALEGLRAEGLMHARELWRVPVEKLAAVIRPAGYYNIKASRLKHLAGFILERSGGDLGVLFAPQRTTAELREALLAVKGIGPETADSILLYAAGRPVFVVDAYTHRILNRHGLVPEETSYAEVQAWFMDRLPHETALFNEFHALIVRNAKTYCGKKPDCVPCPLGGWPAATGPGLI